MTMPVDHFHMFWGQNDHLPVAGHPVWTNCIEEHLSWLGLHSCEACPLIVLQRPSSAGSLPCRVCVGDAPSARVRGGRHQGSAQSVQHAASQSLTLLEDPAGSITSPMLQLECCCTLSCLTASTCECCLSDTVGHQLTRLVVPLSEHARHCRCQGCQRAGQRWCWGTTSSSGQRSRLCLHCSAVHHHTGLAVLLCYC